jgi:H+-transporting ATPase
LLNDGAILSIAYDNVHYKDQPEAWNMRVVLGIATVLGIVGVVAAFGLFYLGERVFHLDRAHIQTLMYLKLSVAGHLTIFLTRTRGPFWSIRPARVLWIAVLGTQAVATLIAVYGLFMTPLGWGWAAFVWGYALVWFLVNDRVKLLAYRILDHIKAETKMETKAVAKPDAKADAPKPDAKADASKPNAKSTTPPDAKADDAKPDAKSDPQPEAKAAPAPETKSAPKPDAKAGPKPNANPDNASVLDKTLGEVLLAGMAKDPEDAGRIIAAALTQADRPAAATPAPETKGKSAPDAEAKPEPDAGAKKPPAPTSKADE